MKLMQSVRVPRLTALLVLLLASPLASQQDQSFTVAGGAVHVQNLVGEMRVERTTGANVEIEIQLRGRDAGQLRVERGRSDGRESVAVVFPEGNIVYPALGRSRSQISMRDGGLLAGRTFNVSGYGDGIEAHAIVRVRLPAGADAAFHQGVGSLRIADVQGTVTARTNAAGVEVENFAGDLTVNTGSGGIRAQRLRGVASLRTGSGGVRLSAAEGERMEVRTGSGGIDLRGSTVQQLTLSAGSGRLQIEDVRARSITARTGSGGITARLNSAPAELMLNTGSGGVNLTLPRGTGAALDINTGSGGIRVDLPTTTVSSGRSHLRATTGDGSGRVRIRTGSGGVTVRQG
jgi:hypothetical protein